MADTPTFATTIQPYAKNETEKNRFILKQLVTKDFKRKYRRSVLMIPELHLLLQPKSVLLMNLP